MKSLPIRDDCKTNGGRPVQLSRGRRAWTRMLPIKRFILLAMSLYGLSMALAPGSAAASCPDCSCNSIPSYEPVTFPTLNHWYYWEFMLTDNTEAVESNGGVQVVTSTWTEAGALPTGMTFSKAGVFTGTPTSKGVFHITVSGSLPAGLDYPAGCTWSKSYTLSLGCATITVTPASLPSATLNTAYSQQFAQTGASGATTWSETGALPTGVTFTSTGLLGGKPTEPGIFPITVTVKDANGCTGTRTLSLAVECHTITISPTTLPDASLNVTYNEQFTQAGATGATNWSETGSLPTGITLTTTGVLAGKPTAAGSFTITVTVKDSQNCAGIQVVKLRVCPSIPIFPGSLTLPTGTVEKQYSEQFTQVGGVAPVTWSETGALPADITLTTAGLFAGTPTEKGTFPFTLTVKDANGCTENSALALIVNCGIIQVSPTSLLAGTVKTPYSQQFTQGGGEGSLIWSEAGALPTGITLTTAGLLTGTPTVKGAFPITVTVKDSNGCSGTWTPTLTVGCQTITVTPITLPLGQVNIPYTRQFAQVGAVGATTWSETGALPTGITLTSSGKLAGTPTQQGIFPITVTVKDANGCTGSAKPTLDIVCQTITVTPTSLPAGTVNTAYSQQFAQVGAVGAVTWSETGALPAGVTLTAAGRLAGTPTVKGAFPITVTVKDANKCTGVRSLTLTVG